MSRKKCNFSEISKTISGCPEKLRSIKPTIGKLGFAVGLMGRRKDLTNRDLSVLELLDKHLCLTARQILLLADFPSLDRAQRRLLALYQKGLLARIPFFTTRPGRQEFCYFLSREGWKLIGECSSERVLKKPPQIKSNFFLNHLLLINDFWITLELACENSPFELEEFIPEFEHGHKRGEKPTKIAFQSQKEKITLIPDAIFCLKGPKGKRLYFLEIDRGTGKISSRAYRSFSSQIQKYLLCYQAQAYARFRETFNYPFSGFQVLYLTSSEQRIKSYQKALAELGDLGRFVLFACFEKLSPHLVLDKIWHPAKSKGRLYSIWE